MSKLTLPLQYVVSGCIVAIVILVVVGLCMMLMAYPREIFGSILAVGVLACLVFATDDVRKELFDRDNR